MIRPRTLAIALVVVLAGVAPGCSDDGSDKTTSQATASGTPTTTTRSAPRAKVPASVVVEYAGFGNAIYQIGDNYGRASKDAAGWSEAVASKYFRGLADTTRNVARGLQKATPHPSLEKDRVAVVAGLKRMADDLDALAAAKNGSAAQAAAKRITADAEQVNTPLNSIAASIGASGDAAQG